MNLSKIVAQAIHIVPNYRFNIKEHLLLSLVLHKVRLTLKHEVDCEAKLETDSKQTGR